MTVGTSGAIADGTSRAIGETGAIAEPGEPPRITRTIFEEEAPLRTESDEATCALFDFNSIPYEIKKRVAPILEVHSIFENKCISLGLLNRSQSATIKRTFSQYLKEILPVINSDLRYQHSEPLAAVLLMFAWENLKLPIKTFLKTIDLCTKKDLGRIGAIRKCKAFSMVKKLKQQVDLIYA